MSHTLLFIGGGNMASALIAGLYRAQAQATEQALHSGEPAPKALKVGVVEPNIEQIKALQAQFGLQGLLAAASLPELLSRLNSQSINAQPASAANGTVDAVVWAVKPQVFKTVAQAAASHLKNCGPQGQSPLHFSVAAGITSASLAAWLGSERVVRAMPNTPALIGQGMTGLFARPAVAADAAALALVEALVAPSGQWLWVPQEADLDAVTALSGSGPAYMFYFLESMVQAGCQLGLAPEAAKQLAIATMQGAATLAAQSPESPALLRERVTSKGGTTYAALTHMAETQVGPNFEQAMVKAAARAAELGREFGG